MVKDPRMVQDDLVQIRILCARDHTNYRYGFNLTKHDRSANTDSTRVRHTCGNRYVSNCYAHRNLIDPKIFSMYIFGVIVIFS